MNETKTTLEECISLLQEQKTYDTYEIDHIMKLFESTVPKDFFSTNTAEEICKKASDYAKLYYSNKIEPFDAENLIPDNAIANITVSDVCKYISIADLVGLLVVHTNIEKYRVEKYTVNLKDKDKVSLDILATSLKLGNLSLSRLLLYLYTINDDYDINTKAKVCIGVFHLYPKVCYTKETIIDSSIVDAIYNIMLNIDFCKSVIKIAYSHAGIKEDWGDTE